MNNFFRLLSQFLRFPGKRKSQNLLDSSSIIISRVCIGVLVAGIVIVLLFLNTYSGKATIFEWMLACLLFGVFIGFLFGIPKILQGGSQNAAPAANPQPAQTTQMNTAAPTASAGSTSPFTYQQQVNTNLTEISDWLTKIIVGLGLVNLTKIPHYLQIIANIPAKALILKGENGDMAFAFAYSTIVTYSLLGFLFGYIITRIFLAKLFLDADRSSLALDVLSSRITQVNAAANSANNKAELALASTTTSPQQQAVVRVTPEQQMDSHIQDYNDTRQNMPSGNPRTSKMTDIFSQMIKVASSVQTFDLAAALSDNNNAGRRLAAYAYLFAKPDVNFFDPLIDALVNDPLPFNQYSAIQALKRIQDRQPYSTLSFSRFTKLKTYYDHLVNAEDRKYELGKIFPLLTSKT
jgi:hypothetical protein